MEKLDIEKIDISRLSKSEIEKLLTNNFKRIDNLEKMIKEIQLEMQENPTIETDIINGWRDWIDTIDKEREKWTNKATNMGITIRKLGKETEEYKQTSLLLSAKLNKIRILSSEKLEWNNINKLKSIIRQINHEATSPLKAASQTLKNMMLEEKLTNTFAALSYVDEPEDEPEEEIEEELTEEQNQNQENKKENYEIERIENTE